MSSVLQCKKIMNHEPELKVAPQSSASSSLLSHTPLRVVQCLKCSGSLIGQALKQLGIQELQKVTKSHHQISVCQAGCTC